MDQRSSEYKPLMRVSDKNKCRDNYVFVIFAIAVMLTAASTLNAAGSHLDYTFLYRGKAELFFPGTDSDDCDAVAIQADGKIVLAGTVTINGHNDIGVARFLASGLPDTSFGNNGTVTTDFFGGTDAARSIVIQPDGKIVVAGIAYANNRSNFGVVRYNPNGSLDTTFSGNGKVFFAFSNSYSEGETLALQADGKLVVAGFYVDAGLTYGWAVARLTTNGALDPTFGPDGRMTLDFAGEAVAKGISVQPNGKIVVGGYAALTSGGQTQFAAARYNANGSLDTSFGSTGLVVTNFGALAAQPNNLRLMPDGRIVMAGTAFSNNSHIALVRYNPNGSLDTTFGSGGKVIGPAAIGADLALQPNGNVVAVGIGNSGPPPFIVARFLANGAPDATFGTGGEVRSVFGPGYSVKAVTLQSDGKIVAAGTGNLSFVVARYNPISSAVKSDFTGDGHPDFAVWRPGNGAWYISDGNRSGQTTFLWGTGGDIPSPGDYDRDGKTDYAVYRPSTGTWYIVGSSDNTFITVQYGIAEDDPVAADYDGDGFTDIAVWRPSTGTWYLRGTSMGYTAIAFGLSSDKPTPGDYDGDGLTDISVFRPSNGYWYQDLSLNGFSARPFGSNGDRVAPGDYDGDGKTDIAVWRPSTGNWYMINSSDGSIRAANWGSNGDIPAPADLDADGKTDLTVFRPSNGVWYALQSGNGGVRALQWGQNGDVPISSRFGQ